MIRLKNFFKPYFQTFETLKATMVVQNHLFGYNSRNIFR